MGIAASRAISKCVTTRSTYKLTWEEIVAPYRLTFDSPPHNFEPRYNVCPTDPIDTIVAQNGKRNLIPMR
jgi:putative SOS response-associated peptidase YedK